MTLALASRLFWHCLYRAVAAAAAGPGPFRSFRPRPRRQLRPRLRRPLQRRPQRRLRPHPAGDEFDTQEYRNSNYAVAANAIAAYTAGATGKGIKIGIVDSGINPNLSEFAGRIDPASGDVAGNRGISDEGGHGTAVSAVAAAARNNSNTMGVAFDATIISERADDPGSCARKDGCSFFDSAIAAGIDAARVAGAKVINLSLGGSQPGSQLLSAMQRAVNAGNRDRHLGRQRRHRQSRPLRLLRQSSSRAWSSLPVRSIPITARSRVSPTRPAAARNYYLMAVGVDDRAPDQNGAQYSWSGTSFSAPTISGAVALLAQAFPNLTGPADRRHPVQVGNRSRRGRSRRHVRARRAQHRSRLPADRQHQPCRQPGRRSAPSTTAISRPPPGDARPASRWERSSSTATIAHS